MRDRHGRDRDPLDLGAHLTAEVIEREQASRTVDVKFAHAAARLYSELARVTGDEAHRRRRDHYVAVIGELEAGAAGVAA